MNFPGYWANEASGVLVPVVHKYMEGEDLDAGELDLMKEYLRQWMRGPWRGAGIDRLRERVEEIDDSEALRRWFADALELAIDPL